MLTAVGKSDGVILEIIDFCVGLAEQRCDFCTFDQPQPGRIPVKTPGTHWNARGGLAHADRPNACAVACKCVNAGRAGMRSRRPKSDEKNQQEKEAVERNFGLS